MRLTPYDTGQRAEPKVWEARHRESEEDFGKVDFNAEDDFTIATLYLERDPDGVYVLRGYTNLALRIEVESNDPTDEEITIGYPHDREYPSPDVLYDQRFGDSGEYPGDDERD